MPSPYAPLTMQVGDRTYAGEWTIRGRALIVRCEHGAKSAPLGVWDSPERRAEKLLFEIYRDAGQL